jgi:uncharacterized protein (TIGR03437 family)
MMGDFNGDGKTDLAIGNGGLVPSFVTIWLGNGTGSFSAPADFSLNLNAGVESMVTGDFNGDGKLDLAFSDRAVDVLLNGCPAGAFANASAASFNNASFAAESIVSAFGSGLATVSQPATTLPLPTSIGGTMVSVTDSQFFAATAPLFYVSPTQVNYQIPQGLAAGAATVTITSGDGTVSTSGIQITRIAPGIFTANSNGQGVAAAIAQRVKPDGSSTYELIAEFNATLGRYVLRLIDLGPSTDQVFLQLYGTGIRLRTSQLAVVATIGGVDAPVLYAGAQGDFAGLDQVNLRLSRELIGKGEVDLVLTVDNQAANTVRINIK